MNMTIEQITNFIIERLANLSQIPVDHFDVNQPLANYGVDSIHALSLCAELEEWLKIEIDPTFAWDYPTISLMASYILSEIN
ncbi:MULTISPECIES: acyl carrier protein [unclassified Acinetobacter]|uniref:acyl carrier protein n=1 Tax=unclassified Acinetobacter TaxID=196816 RepID=UPI0018EC3C87|nr:MULTISPECIES: acyl carrier protein [unclassified Acinetobacter]MBJ6352985.1 acyl carrier protein [Acinetobacter sp. c1]MBM0958604.1 acyl carrier protein [Acinetobacter sp. C13]